MKADADKSTIIIDTQEKKGRYKFERLLELGWSVVVKHLRTGDCRLAGTGAVVEFKTVPDWLGCVPDTPHQRQREERKLADLGQFPRHLLVIEAELWMLARGYEWCGECGATGRVVRGTRPEEACPACLGHRVVKWRSKVHPNSVLHTLIAWQARHGLSVVFGGTQDQCVQYIESWFEKQAAEIRRTLMACGPCGGLEEDNHDGVLR